MMDHGYHNQTHSIEDPRRLRKFGFRVAVMSFLALLFALNAPAGLGLATFSSLTSLGAIVIAIMGAIRAEKLSPDRLTRWDVAAALMLISMMSGALVNPEVLEAAAAYLR